MSDNIDIVLQDLSKRIHVPLSMVDGALILSTEDGDKVWLEVPPEGALIVIHCSLKESVTDHTLSLSEMQSILKLNSKLNVLKGAWIAMHSETNTLRLCASVPKGFVDAETLEVVLNNVVSLSKVIKEMLLSGDIYSSPAAASVPNRMQDDTHLRRRF